jgi:hypothetical protein
MQNTNGGLVLRLDPSTLSPRAMPTLWRVFDADLNPFAIGDVVVDSLQSVAGVPVVRLVGGIGFAGQYGLPDRQVSLLSTPINQFGVVVGVAPAAPFAPGQPVIAAGGGASRFIWVIAARSFEFDIRGDSSTPARGESITNGAAPVSITPDGIASGAVTASLSYAPPTAAGSGIKLNGASFNLAGDGELAVVDLAPGVALAPGALYRVRLRFPKAFTYQPRLQASSDAM